MVLRRINASGVFGSDETPLHSQKAVIGQDNEHAGPRDVFGVIGCAVAPGFQGRVDFLEARLDVRRLVFHLRPGFGEGVVLFGQGGDGLADQVLKIVDQAVGEGYADPARLALWGHSFGGYGALVVATQTSRFAAIVDTAGPADLVSLRGVFDIHVRVIPQDYSSILAMAGWAETGQGGLGTTPWGDAARYVRNSPVFFADKITTPILMAYGDRMSSGWPRARRCSRRSIVRARMPS